jgi:hypothetical protein
VYHYCVCKFMIVNIHSLNVSQIINYEVKPMASTAVRRGEHQVVQCLNHLKLKVNIHLLSKKIYPNEVNVSITVILCTNQGDSDNCCIPFWLKESITQLYLVIVKCVSAFNYS